MPTATPVNYWRDDKCARAFWNQHEMPAYQELLNHTAAWLDPRPRERWLDLGCGGGQLSRLLWVLSGGTLAEVVGLDCAPVNAHSYEKLRRQLDISSEASFRFQHVDFSAGLPLAEDMGFDGAVSGLAIQYAETWSESLERWTDAGYDRLLREVFRLLRPGGRFVFSVNVPEPSWGKVAWSALGHTFRAQGKLRYLKKLWRLWSYGGWLKREARKGRFHFLPAEAVTAKLQDAGFQDVEHQLSFAGQAFVFRCRKP